MTTIFSFHLTSKADLHTHNFNQLWRTHYFMMMLILPFASFTQNAHKSNFHNNFFLIINAFYCVSLVKDHYCFVLVKLIVDYITYVNCLSVDLSGDVSITNILRYWDKMYVKFGLLLLFLEVFCGARRITLKQIRKKQL